MLDIQRALGNIARVPVVIDGDLHMVPTNTPLGEQALRAQIAELNLRLSEFRLGKAQQESRHFKDDRGALQSRIDSSIAYLDQEG
jgi:hypothetical protein